MNPALRLSPVHDLLQSLDGVWDEIHGMPVLATLEGEGAIAPQLGIADLSCLPRFGVKGAGAAAWLASQGIPIPEQPNSWLPLPLASLPQGKGSQPPVPLLPGEKGTGDEGLCPGMIARLGLNEFLIEDSLHSDLATHLMLACQHPPAKVYPVLRQDLAIALCGTLVNELLLQTCNINFHALDLSQHPVILTSMIGVAVTVIPGERSGQPFYRIWCDGTFGVYVWQTLVAIAQELGGGVMGIANHWILTA